MPHYNGWRKERILLYSEYVLYPLLSASVVVVVLYDYNGWGKERILRYGECVLYLLLSESVVVVVFAILQRMEKGTDTAVSRIDALSVVF